MAYTEIKERNGRKYFYRVISIREGDKISKKRIYLGVNLSEKEISQKEQEADKPLNLERNANLLNRIRKKIAPVLAKSKIKRAGIFGSYALGEQKKDSDIDIVIEAPKNLGFGFAKIQFQLQDKLGRKVDLVTYKSLNSLIKERILNEEVRII